MASKLGGYKSDAELRGTRENPAFYSAPITVTRAEYDAVLEYTCALKAENAELKSGGGDDITTIRNLEAASAATKTATNNTSGIFAELRTLHTEQMKEMAALVAASTAINTNAPPLREGKAQIYMNPDGTRRVRYTPPRGVKTTGVDRKGRAVRTGGNCTKN